MYIFYYLLNKNLSQYISCSNIHSHAYNNRYQEDTIIVPYSEFYDIDAEFNEINTMPMDLNTEKGIFSTSSNKSREINLYTDYQNNFDFDQSHKLLEVRSESRSEAQGTIYNIAAHNRELISFDQNHNKKNEKFTESLYESVQNTSFISYTNHYTEHNFYKPSQQVFSFYQNCVKSKMAKNLTGINLSTKLQIIHSDNESFSVNKCVWICPSTKFKFLDFNNFYYENKKHIITAKNWHKILNPKYKRAIKIKKSYTKRKFNMIVELLSSLKFQTDICCARSIIQNNANLNGVIAKYSHGKDIEDTHNRYFLYDFCKNTALDKLNRSYDVYKMKITNESNPKKI